MNRNDIQVEQYYHHDYIFALCLFKSFFSGQNLAIWMVSCWQTLFWRLVAVLKNIILFVLLERRSTHIARITIETIILDKVFKNGPSKICRRQPLKNFKWYGRPYHFNLFKDSLPQIVLGPFLNTLSQLQIGKSSMLNF